MPNSDESYLYPKDKNVSPKLLLVFALRATIVFMRVCVTESSDCANASVFVLFCIPFILSLWGCLHDTTSVSIKCMNAPKKYVLSK